MTAREKWLLAVALLACSAAAGYAWVASDYKKIASEYRSIASGCLKR